MVKMAICTNTAAWRHSILLQNTKF